MSFWKKLRPFTTKRSHPSKSSWSTLRQAKGSSHKMEKMFVQVLSSTQMWFQKTTTFIWCRRTATGAVLFQTITRSFSQTQRWRKECCLSSFLVSVSITWTGREASRCRVSCNMPRNARSSIRKSWTNRSCPSRWKDACTLCEDWTLPINYSGVG